MRIPNHLKQYIVEQNYDNYTFINQACWRFIMRISINFFKDNADNIYIEGLKKTGITIDEIPHISSIDKKLSRFGWRAVCVRGFIPPNAFMEFQSLKILPIAADMRNHQHITYTPSPDIVHEAADTIYHLLVTLEAADIKFEDVLKELENRKKQSGIEEKNNR